ncbi:MAG: phosphoribosylformimino-5-aminoimidazole carboxamide ribotide isomerase [Verrucomicrobiae bacterium]|nr:phosphoribosylformimino-5-aminoimidazole carboxamide ribotide isomerase [Verrucomicrobiae bacterium]
MTKFRPCIDLHEGRVKQIVGSTLDTNEGVQTNFETNLAPSYFAGLYREDAIAGAHVIMLGPGNSEAALDAIRAYPEGLQVGGGIRPDNADTYLDAGASHVIVTSWIFDEHARLDVARLQQLSRAVGKEKLVIDLSCRAVDGEGWVVAMNRWQTLTDVKLNDETLDFFADYCAELLVHAADVEGKCGGMDEELIQVLGRWGKLPVTYAGGARSIDDLTRVNSLSSGSVDLTIGSALDIFGGSLIRYRDCVEWNQRSS